MATSPNKPAFARASAEHSHGGNYEQDGMTLREHYAGLALQGMLASQGNGGEYFRPEVIVKEAVAFSDALIAELSKTEGGA